MQVEWEWERERIRIRTTERAEGEVDVFLDLAPGPEIHLQERSREGGTCPEVEELVALTERLIEDNVTSLFVTLKSGVSEEGPWTRWESWVQWGRGHATRKGWGPTIGESLADADTALRTRDASLEPDAHY